MGLHDVNYHSDSYYTENFVAEKEAYGESRESLKIDGTGFDVKAGVIFRPVESSPFRIGVYVNSPVFYDLTMKGTADLYLIDNNIVNDQGSMLPDITRHTWVTTIVSILPGKQV